MYGLLGEYLVEIQLFENLKCEPQACIDLQKQYTYVCVCVQGRRLHIGELGSRLGGSTVRAAKRTDILVYLLGIRLELLHSYQQVINP